MLLLYFKIYKLQLKQISIILKKQNNSKTGETKIIQDVEVPVAKTQIKQLVKFEYQSQKNNNLQVILTGIDLDTKCDNQQQPTGYECNSDGFWPSLMNFNVTDCQQQEQYFQCIIRIDIERSWTPQNGGFLPLKLKKGYNFRLNFDLKVYSSLIIGKKSEFLSENFQFKSKKEWTNSNTGYKITKTYDKKENYSQQTIGITGFGFQFQKPIFDTTPKTLFMQYVFNKFKIPLHNQMQQLGRYISGLDFSINNISNNQSDSQIKFDINMQVFTPITVVNSGIFYQMDVAVLNFNENIKLQQQKQIEGEICINSSEQAPLFSRWWQKCGKDPYGPFQSQDSIKIQSKN